VGQQSRLSRQCLVHFGADVAVVAIARLIEISTAMLSLGRRAVIAPMGASLMGARCALGPS
jgi:hypothetical protein